MREAKEFRVCGRGGGTDSHASDIGHWLGMTPLRGVGAAQGVRCVNVSPSVTAKGRDTSLAEGGKAAPVGAAGR